MTRTRACLGPSILALSLLASACGAATVAPSTSVPASPPSPVSRWRTILAPEPGAWAVVPVLPGGFIRVVDEGSDGRLLVVGGIRARDRGGEVEIAGESSATEIYDAVHFPGGWYFGTSNGTVLRSDDFLGPLGEVGMAPTRILSGLMADGVLAARLDDHGVAYFTEGAGFVRLPAPVDGPLLDAAFLTPDVAVAIAPPGRAFFTGDGATFREVPVGAGTPLQVWPLGGALYVRTTLGTVRVAADGTTEDVAAVPWPPGLDDDALDRLDAALFARAPFDASDRPGLDGASVLDDGEGAIRVIRVDGSITRLSAPAPDCVVASFAGLPFAACPTSAAAYETWVADDGATFRSLGRVRPRSDLPFDETFFFSPDGSSVVVRGRCGDGEPVGEWDGHVCWHDGTTYREREGFSSLVILGVYRDRAVVGVYRDDSGELWLSRVDLAGDAPPELFVAPPPIEQLFDPQITGDGWLVVDDLLGSGTLLRGPLDGALELVPAPDGALFAAFADAAHGLAIGGTVDVAWTTDDGGTTWAPLELPFAGVPLRYANDVDHRPACSVGGCRSPGAFFWAPRRLLPTDPPTRLFWSATPPLVTAPSPAPGSDWTCERPPGAPPPADEQLLVGAGWARLVETEGTARSIAVAWGGVDERGAFTDESTPSPAPAPSSDLVLVAATRRFAIVGRAGNEGDRFRHTLLVAEAGGGVRTVELATDGDLRDAAFVIDAGLVGPSGEVLVRASAELADARSAALDVALLFDAAGREVARRTFAFPRDVLERMAALDEHGDAGVASRDEHGEVTFHPLAGGADRALGVLPDATGPCGRARGARFLRDVGRPSGLVVGADRLYAPFENVVELGRDGRACVRSIFPASRVGLDELASRAHGVPIVLTGRRGVRTIAIAPGGHVELECAP